MPKIAAILVFMPALDRRLNITIKSDPTLGPEL
jgi:hypothetical protein